MTPEVIEPPSRTVLLGHVSFFAADSLYGRRAGSQHERRAADYIRDRFTEIGLVPGVPGYFQSFQISVPVDGQSGLFSRNVLGILPGQGNLAGQWVILGAHYDHLGFTQAGGDSVIVYNGADDNASGTALLLEIARVLNEYVARDEVADVDRRSIMFQAYGAEEVGLVGSYHFCRQPAVHMDSIVAMVNLDMVGRLRDNTLGLIGMSSSTGWVNVVAGANGESLHLTLVDGMLHRSDQYCFYQNERPVLFLHTGLHDDYHTPRDDVELINGSGMVKVGNLALGVLMDLALRSRPLSFTGGPLLDPIVIPRRSRW
ncbi:MAG: M28 family peptidase [Gemmatimonadota bacterium]